MLLLWSSLSSRHGRTTLDDFRGLEPSEDKFAKSPLVTVIGVPSLVWGLPLLFSAMYEDV